MKDITFEILKENLIDSSKYYEEAKRSIEKVDNYLIHRLLNEDWNNTRRVYMSSLSERFVNKFFQ